MKHYNSNNFLYKHIASRLFFFLFVATTTIIPAKVDEILPNSLCEKVVLKDPIKAVIKDPIIEMNNSFPPPSNPVISGETEKCLRAHQGLFNELVTVLEEQDDCCKVACRNAVYGCHKDTQEQLNTFWIYKQGIVPLTDLHENVLQTIPHSEYGQEPTIVLTYPWKSFSGKTFSVGTRFKHDPQHDTLICYAIKRADFMANTILLEFIPRKNAIVETKKHPHLARKLFIKNIHELIHRVARTGKNESGLNNVIPYVWGGSSFVEPYADSFCLQNGYWYRDGKKDPYTGYDCSEFVMRMAQIAGIEFPWKTTSMIERSKRALAENERLEPGDLIWIQGHVMIVGNIKRNEVIESRGYKSGYGCVHSFTLQECFDGIRTYDDLLKYYHAKKMIQLKDKQGVVQEKLYPFKLLKLID